MRGSDVATLVEFHQLGLGGDSVMDKWMDDRGRDRWKNNVALAHLYYAEKLCSKFGRILPSGLGGYIMTDTRRTDILTNG